MSQNQSIIGYETTIITKPDLTDEGYKALLDKIKTIISQYNGQIIDQQNWGKRKLSYPIKKETKGVYTYIVFNGNNKLVEELERNFKINEDILRYLTIKLGYDFDASKYKKPVTPVTKSSGTESQVH
jgi:small subunit ribosomal protein S6